MPRKGQKVKDTSAYKAAAAKRWADPEEHKRHSAACKGIPKCDGFGEMVSRNLKRYFSHSENRDAVSTTSKEVWKRPGHREQQALAKSMQWEQGIFKDHGKKMEAAWERNHDGFMKSFTSEQRAKVARDSLNGDASIAKRARTNEVNFSNPDYVAWWAGICKERWNDPEYAKRCLYRPHFGPSKIQTSIFEYLRKKGIHGLRLEHRAINYFLDIAHLPSKTAIEIDGAYWHQDKKYDARRDRRLLRMGWTVHRFPASEDSKRPVLKLLRKEVSNCSQ